MKGDEAWLALMAQTGAWDDPPYWTDPQYVAASPWSVAEVDDAFAELRRIYTRPRARAIFQRAILQRQEQEQRQELRREQRHEPALWQVLADLLFAPHSRLVALGLDAAACGSVWNRKNLVDALIADGRGFEGACFEVAFFAALTRALVPCTHEPLAVAADKKRKKGEPNPDFSATIGRELLLELKLSRESDRTRDERKWHIDIAMGTERTAGIPSEIKLLPAFREMQERDGGSWMRQNFKRLLDLLEDSKERLAASAGPFPAEEVIEESIHLKVKGPRGSGPGGGTLGPPPNVEREARRIVRGLLSDGATQIPAERIGIVVIDPGWSADVGCLCAEVRRWMIEEGAAYSQVVGAAIISRRYAIDYALSLALLTPVWRDTAPREVRDSDAWNRIELALSHGEIRCFEFRTGKSFAAVLAELGAAGKPARGSE